MKLAFSLYFIGVGSVTSGKLGPIFHPHLKNEMASIGEVVLKCLLEELRWEISKLAAGRCH